MALSLERKFVITALTLLLGAWVSQTTARTIPELTMADKHEQWMARYGRVYKDETEKEIRFKIFNDNVEFIESFNKARKHSYKLSINEFADQRNEEFIATRNGLKMNSNPKSSQITSFSYENVTVPSSIDWRKKGAVINVTCSKSDVCFVD